MTQLETVRLPFFPFAPPSGYRWLIDKRLVGFTPFTALEPWYFLTDEESFDLSRLWPQLLAPQERIIAFARRQDDDTLACFRVDGVGSLPTVVVVNGWTPLGFELLARHDTVWSWLKAAVDDIEAWHEAAPVEGNP